MAGLMNSGGVCAESANPESANSESAKPDSANSNSASPETAKALATLSQGIREFRLSNGLTVLMYRRGFAPVFAGAVVVRVGGSDEKAGDTGISHMFEHMAFKGTKTIGTRDYEREQNLLDELEKIAVISDSAQKLTPDQKSRWDAIHDELKKLWITDDFTRRYDLEGGTSQNATTDTELTKYYVNLPRKSFEFWCRMEADRLTAPVMRQFYQERDVVLEERRMRYVDDPGGKLYELSLGIAFLQHPFQNPVIGYEHDIQRLTAAKLEAFRKHYYVPGNIVLSLVGDVNPDEDIKMIERYFGGLPVRPNPPRPTIVEGPQSGERRVTLKADASPQVFLGYKKPVFPEPDDAPISVMAEILAGSRISPLYLELVQKRQVAADIGSDEAPGMAYPNLLLFYASVKSPHTTNQVIDVFDAVINRFKKHGPTADQVEVAKRALQTSYIGRLKANLSLATDLASTHSLYGNWKELVRWYDQVTQVTVADVRRVAGKYLATDSRTVATIERRG